MSQVGYLTKNFLLAPLAALFCIPHSQMVVPPMTRPSSWWEGGSSPENVVNRTGPISRTPALMGNYGMGVPIGIF